MIGRLAVAALFVSSVSATRSYGSMATRTGTSPVKPRVFHPISACAAPPRARSARTRCRCTTRPSRGRGEEAGGEPARVQAAAVVQHGGHGHLIALDRVGCTKGDISGCQDQVPAAGRCGPGAVQRREQRRAGRDADRHIHLARAAGQVGVESLGNDDAPHRDHRRVARRRTAVRVVDAAIGANIHGEGQRPWRVACFAEQDIQRRFAVLRDRQSQEACFAPTGVSARLVSITSACRSTCTHRHVDRIAPGISLRVTR